MDIFMYYILAISLFSVIVTVADKLLAINRLWRISEKTLLLLSFFGGSISMLVTMLIIRHKTRKPKFMITLPVLSILHLACFIYIYVFWLTNNKNSNII